MGAEDNFDNNSQEGHSQKTLVDKLDKEIESNIDNNQFGVDSLAQVVGMSRSSLHRKLHKLLGISTSQFIREYSLKKALQILIKEDITASEVAYRVGFSSATYFNTCFKDYYGYPPGEVKYRTAKSSLASDIGDVTKTKFPGGVKPSTRKVMLVALVVLCVVLIGLYFNNKVTKANSQIVMAEEGIGVASIAILPFKNLSDTKESEYFTAGIAQSIQNNLNKIIGLKLISETSMSQYGTTTKSSPEIAAELNVSHLLEASVQQYDDKVRVIVKLIDAKMDEQIWSDTYDRDLIDIFNIQSEISTQIALALEVVLSPTQLSQMNRIPTTDIEAFNLYQKGKHFFNFKTHSHGEGEKSISYFNQAIKKDPEFALAYAALATAHLFSGHNLYMADSIEVVEKLALKAIALDNTISEAHVVLGTLACMYEWNWDKAQKEYELAIQLNPNNSNAYIYYSQFLFSVKGEFDNARKNIDRAISLDPLSYIANLKSAQYYFNLGNYDKTFEETAKLKEINNHNMYGYWINFQTYEALGMNEKAMTELLGYFEKEPMDYIPIASIKKAYEANGINGVYTNSIESCLRKFGPLSNFGDFELYGDAQIYGHIGNHEKALEYLNVAVERRCSYLYLNKYNPFFKDLRSNPQFLAILDKMNLGNYNK